MSMAIFSATSGQIDVEAKHFLPSNEKQFADNNANSKSARSLKYPPHWRALQDFERNDAISFTTQQLSRLHWMLKSFPKESDIIEINNIFQLHQASWTINRDYIKFKFSFKVGLGL